MTPLLRNAFAPAAFVSITLLSGCYVSVEPATRFEGSAVSDTLDYQSGQAVRIVSPNGNVKVTGGSSSSTVSVTFRPFIMEKDDNPDGAKEQMERDLSLVHETDGSSIVFKVVRKDGSSGYLGADVQVTLPSGFAGEFEVDQENGEVDADLRGGLPTKTDIASSNGSVDVYGAAGAIVIDAHNGSGTVSVQQWPATGEGHVTLGNGDLDFTLPADANGTLEAYAENGVVNDSSIPSTWVSAESAPGSKSYTMGDGSSGGLVKISTGLGDINLGPN